ncbi:Dethiobiotin synthetase [Romeria aff. gracilis LEGE 07310]|uniref:Dethiobiotin synthetase n=1 Tax=Vasconcelosia minhoensis LEGE 07310 TaxID=915328 RepID=A0A8J7AWZ1_9CYAN|nr:Dethiobiotin synthetase [Romeria gracilis]MBE9077487.1 Dethiobiotin synthetase [Romeria aff. gracilis LEGE 07310]
MDFKTARQELTRQALPQNQTADTFLGRLEQGQPPVPGQVTSLLLALRAVFDNLREATALDREFAYALHRLAYNSRRCYEQGVQTGVEWPPLLDEDLDRIAIAVNQIFANPASDV